MITAATPPDTGAATITIDDLGIISESRPWGRFTRYAHNTPSTVKIIEVNKGEQLSLQRHRLRDELWVILDPGTLVEINCESWVPNVGESVLIPRGYTHRLSAPTRAIRILEVALGNFDENDIERFEDIYGRS